MKRSQYINNNSARRKQNVLNQTENLTKINDIEGRNNSCNRNNRNGKILCYEYSHILIGNKLNFNKVQFNNIKLKKL